MKFLDKHQVFIMHGNLIYTIFFNEMIISYTCVSLLPIFHRLWSPPNLVAPAHFLPRWKHQDKCYCNHSITTIDLICLGSCKLGCRWIKKKKINWGSWWTHSWPKFALDQVLIFKDLNYPANLPNERGRDPTLGSESLVKVDSSCIEILQCIYVYNACVCTCKWIIIIIIKALS